MDNRYTNLGGGLVKFKDYVQRVKCFFGFHDYGNWEAASVEETLPGKSKPVRYTMFVRECSGCKDYAQAPRAFSPEGLEKDGTWH